MAKINVQQTAITLLKVNEQDYISLTDIARHKSDDPTAVIGNWMRNRNTIEYLGVWETLYNPGFKPIEFEGFRKGSRAECFHPLPAKMDKHYWCHWYCVSFRTLWRYICPQGYCIQVCQLDFRRI